MKLTKGMWVMAVLFLLIAGASAISAYDITGTVTGSGTEPLDGAVINVAIVGGAAVGTFATVADGTYTATVPDITQAYQFDVSAGGYTSQQKSTLVSGNKVLDFVLGPAPTVVLSGTVTDISGNPLQNVQVQIMLNGGVLVSAMTSIAGTYSVNVLDATTYSVEFSKTGYISQTQSITASGPTTLNAQMPGRRQQELQPEQ